MSYAAAAAASHMGNGAFLEVLDEAPHAPPVYHPATHDEMVHVGCPSGVPDKGSRLLEETPLTLLTQTCGPRPPSPPAPPSPPSPPPHAAANLLGWADWVLSDAGSGWQQGFFEHDDGSRHSFLRTSYAPCVATQTVDLLAPRAYFRGYTPREIRDLRLAVRGSVTVQAYATTADSYFASFAILDADGTPLMERTFGGGQYDMLPITIEDGPVTLTAEFTADDMREAAVNISAGLNSDPLAARYVKVTIGGRDGENWNGAYGAEFFDWEVSLGRFPPSPPSPPPSPPSPPSPSPPPPTPPFDSCSLLDEVQWMAGAHVDLLTFVSRGGGDWHERTTIVGVAGGSAGTPLVLEIDEAVVRVRGERGCLPYLACWLVLETDKGRSVDLGSPSPRRRGTWEKTCRRSSSRRRRALASLASPS